MTVNSGDPVNTLAKALDAYTSVQETMIAEAKKLKDPPTMPGPSAEGTREGGAPNAVPASY